MSNKVLTCQSLTWQVDEQSILKQVSFAIERGESISIVGPNGAGKTSLLKCLAGLIDADSGDIYVHNKNLKQLSRRDIAQHITVVNQHHSNPFQLRCREVVHMGLIPHKSWFETDSDADHHKISMALEKVDLLDKQEQHFNTLSGGEQQRVMIARAIVQDPKILLMDEPTNHLDIYYQQQILSLASSLDLTLVMSLHDLNLASYYSDRILMLNHGEVVAFGKPEEVLKETTLQQVFNVPCQVHRYVDDKQNSQVQVQFLPGMVNPRGATDAS
ncbi:ABC transporter ATP-binding protein [Thalassotalea sp. HSM 43]|uniref:ABC transporter ATP-binding protein n=1 Tax=Thalassotalea sp. HSM 43 TaxID=2552945 RepID=UPI001080ABA0|nr:ABC transporter ATP-binding protein [Thalassotalea sp. HSM 43]QBY05684.1 ABC transporter ATP-binding protein [Thalassotalea sp. HSM 43]